MAKKNPTNIIPDEVIMNKILLIRGQKLMINNDLAELYGVTTKRLNERVKRNIKRFPSNFMFQLTEKVKNEVVAICDHLIFLLLGQLEHKMGKKMFDIPFHLLV